MRLTRLAGLAVATLALAGCAGQTAHPGAVSTTDPESATNTSIEVVEDLDFGAPDGVRLDVCRPAEVTDEPLPAIISVHGGGWYQGDKSQPLWRDSCEWLASEGFVVFQTNYRLAPEHPFPAAIEDVATAVEWIREDAQADRFGYDPARLGAFGDSAGGNLVSLLATWGEGDNTTGTRVAAVVELSAPVDLTAEGTELGPLEPSFQNVQLAYLGCDSYNDCPDAAAASPSLQVDATDPPFFVVHATEEFIPVEQADVFVGLLDAAGIDVTYRRIESDAHALDLLSIDSSSDDLRAEIAGWLHSHLGS